MVRTEGEYCYIISKNRIVLLLIEEIKNDFDVILLNGKYPSRCTLESKMPVYFYNNSYFKYEFITNESIDITDKNYVAFDEKEMFLDLSQYYKTHEFRDDYMYPLQDLGINYNSKYTSFKVWSPVARKIKIRIYENDTTTDYTLFDMQVVDKGVWKCDIEGDLKNKFFLYEVDIFGEISTCIDIKCRGASTNGRKGLIININETNPEGFKEHIFVRNFNISDAIICETHIRDFSMHKSSNMVHMGKYKAFTESNTKNSFGLSTGIDHLKDMGVNYVQLLPVFDFCSIDDDGVENNDYSWGYEPQNHNTPEGSYSLDPSDPTLRIKEFKELVMNLHNNGIGVIIDVVFTHMFSTMESNFQKLVPNFYFRTDNFGNSINATGKGNVIASERFMVRKYIIESILYWATEYRVDGFRFHQMALLDIDTLNEIRMSLDKIDTSIIMYGEGWSMNSAIIRRDVMASRENASFLSSRIALYLSGYNNKGNFSKNELAYFLGNGSVIEDIKSAFVGSVAHPQVDLKKLQPNDSIVVKSPMQSVNCLANHTGLTLWDVISKKGSLTDRKEIVAINKLLAIFNFLAQGIVLFQLGEEFGRTKFGEENTSRSPDRINSINWDRKTEFLDLFYFYKGLIALRKSDSSFRMSSMEEIKDTITFEMEEETHLVIKLKSRIEEYDHYLIIFNTGNEDFYYNLEKKHSYYVLVDGEHSGVEVISKVKKQATVKSREGLVLAYSSAYGKK